MIQTTNKYSKETFIRLNYWYDRIHELVQEDIDKVNTMVEHIEKTRSDRYPRTGDNLVFVSGYGERSRLFFIDAYMEITLYSGIFPVFHSCPVTKRVSNAICMAVSVCW